MAAKMIEELEITYTSFCASYTVIMDLDTKKSRGGKFVLGNGRSSRPDVFCRKGVLRNFAKFTGKHLCQSLFLIKLQTIPFFTEHLR